jgi:hypothetical protein
MVKSGLLGIHFDDPSFQYLFSSLLGKGLNCDLAAEVDCTQAILDCRKDPEDPTMKCFKKQSIKFSKTFKKAPKVVVAVNAAALNIPGSFAATMPFRITISSVTTTGFHLKCFLTTYDEPTDPISPFVIDPIMTFSWIACD